MSFDPQSLWNAEREEHLDVTHKTFDSLESEFTQLVDLCTTAIKNGNKIMFFGNGGSASDAQHLATELTIRFKDDRAPIAGLALTTDTSALTAAGNDYGFDYIFSRQLEALGNEGDVAIGLSTSGNSPNVLNALKSAKEKGISTVGFSGKDGGKMSEACDLLLVVPSNTTARIQEMHITIGHMLCAALEQNLNLV